MCSSRSAVVVVVAVTESSGYTCGGGGLLYGRHSTNKRGEVKGSRLVAYDADHDTHHGWVASSFGVYYYETNEKSRGVIYLLCSFLLLYIYLITSNLCVRRKKERMHACKNLSIIRTL